MNYIDEIINQNPSIKHIIVDGLNEKISNEDLDRLTRRLTRLIKRDLRIVIFKPHIKLNYGIKSCFSRPFAMKKNSCEIDAKALRKLDDDFERTENALKNLGAEVKFFNPNDLFCQGRGCSYVANGIPLVRDDATHLSEYGSQQLSNIFVNWAKKNVPSLTDR